jgi:hypothetical protein
MKYIIALITIFISLTGCSEEPPEEYARIITSTLLNATWTSECIPDGENSYILVLVFTSSGGILYNSGSGTSSQIYHTADITCSTIDPVTLEVNTFSYNLGNNVVVDGSVAEITEATEIDTTTNTPAGLITFGVADFDIFAIKDKFTLYFGNKTDTNDGTTIELRPTQLSDTDTVIYTR